MPDLKFLAVVAFLCFGILVVLVDFLGFITLQSNRRVLYGSLICTKYHTRLRLPLPAPAAEDPERFFISRTFQDHLPCNMEAAPLPSKNQSRLGLLTICKGV